MAVLDILNYPLAQAVLANLLSATIIGLIAFMFRHAIEVRLKKIIPQLTSKVPHINFEIKYIKTKNSECRQKVLISNAGNEPAYNVYVLYFEQFPDGPFTIHGSKCDPSLKRSTLGIRDEITFDKDPIDFDGCNSTCRQEIWIEYENAAGINFRAVYHPPTPIGDVGRMSPPKTIKYRLDQIPGHSIKGSRYLAKRYKRGLVKPLVRGRKIESILWRLKYLIKNR